MFEQERLMKKQCIFILCAVITLFFLISPGPELIAAANEPATKLEAFLSKVETLIVIESVDLGRVEGTYGSHVEIKAIVSYEPISANKKTSGFQVVVYEGGRNEQRKTVFVDLDEIENVSNAAEYMISLSDKWKAVRRLNTEVAFTTRDTFRIGFSQSGYSWQGFSSGGYGVGAVCRFNSLEDLKAVKLLIDSGIEWVRSNEGR